MIKQYGAMLLLSIFLGLVTQAVVVPAQYSTGIVYVSYIMGYIFLFAMILVISSMVIALIPRMVYFFFKKNNSPDFNVFVWSIWIILATLILSSQIYKNLSKSEVKPTIANKIFNNTANKVYQSVEKSVYMIYSKDISDKPIGSGTAIAVTDKYLATNCHIIKDGNHFNILVNGKNKPGKLYSEHGDICIVSVDDIIFEPVAMRFSKDVLIGEEVFAVGNPEGFKKTISRGIISNKHNDDGVIILQTDAAISPGSSGGGLFDHNGKLIGITTIKLVREHDESMAFAISTEVITAALLEPVTPAPSPKPVVATTNHQILSHIGYYGEDEIGLMQWHGSCFITIVGRRQETKETSLAIWYPSVPNGLFIFSKIVNASDAIKFISSMNKSNNVKYIESKSFVFFDKKLYPLILMSVDNVHYPVYIFSVKNDLTENLVSLDYFVGQFYGYNHDQGMTTITFGLSGFTEALAAYNENCGGNN